MVRIMLPYIENSAQTAGGAFAPVDFTPPEHFGGVYGHFAKSYTNILNCKH